MNGCLSGLLFLSKGAFEISVMFILDISLPQTKSSDAFSQVSNQIPPTSFLGAASGQWRVPFKKMRNAGSI